MSQTNDDEQNISTTTYSGYSCVVVAADEETPFSTRIVASAEEWSILLDSELGDSVKVTPLIRPSSGDAGLFAFASLPTNQNSLEDQVPNTRATCLAMACGLFSLRFLGKVILVRCRAFLTDEFKTIKDEEKFVSLTSQEVAGACLSPDLRHSIQKILVGDSMRDNQTSLASPSWLANASQRNYHDASTMARLATVMSPTNSEPLAEDDSSATSSSSIQPSGETKDTRKDETYQELESNLNDNKHFIARSSLCLHCRGPTSVLCPDCKGAYFCDKPRTCRETGWSHTCLCRTWKLYCDRRSELSLFPFDSWHNELLERQCQLSEEPYCKFLERLGVSFETGWWTTESDGWSGGESQSAKTIDISVRRSFANGFAPVKDFPEERYVQPEDVERCQGREPLHRNRCGLLLVSSWQQYYELRNIPRSSPVALLLTFPLTLYYAISKYGEVPVTVSCMLKRPLRVHVVGIEKELNFMDIFKEVGFLLPEDVQVELVFVVRKDMLPTKLKDSQSTIEIDLTTNLTLILVSGTYGDSLDPNFDCGSGAPDMVVGLNAGLFAYESWRSVVSYLHHHNGVVGVFTDYNEHSGQNCASIGGARESLVVNPFRQPRAMKTYCMNLPQFSNGFIYVYNEQELDM